MNNQKENLVPHEGLVENRIFNGVYGQYTINNQDKQEVQLYRLSLLFCSIASCLCLAQWIFIGPSYAWIWLILMSIGLGSSLKWIHIYLVPLHKALQILWGVGFTGIIILLIKVGSVNLLSTIANKPIWLIAIGPIFASLTGLGFKEFFCFRRPEAIGLTLFIPIALLGHISTFLGREIVMSLLIISSLLLVILALRKLGNDAAADIGDKSIFEYLANKETPSTT